MGISSFGGLAYWVYQALVVWHIGYIKLWLSGILEILGLGGLAYWVSSFSGLGYWVYQALVVWCIGYIKLWWSGVLDILDFGGLAYWVLQAFTVGWCFFKQIFLNLQKIMRLS